MHVGGAGAGGAVEAAQEMAGAAGLRPVGIAAAEEESSPLPGIDGYQSAPASSSWRLRTASRSRGDVTVKS
jgi:hypothetical protein